MANGMLSNYVQDLQKVEEEFQTGDRNVGEYILGTGYYGVAKPVESVIDAVVPNLGVGEFVGEQIARTGLPQYIQENTSEDTRRALSEGLGLFGVTPVGRMVGRAPETRGMYATGGRVYKTGHYNPTEVELNKVEEAALKNVAEETKNRYKALKGNVSFTLDGLQSVADLFFNPKSRAMFTEYGLNPVYSKVYKDYRRAVESGNTDEARAQLQILHNQAQAMENIKRQAGQKPKKVSATEDFVLAASDPASPATYNALRDHGPSWYHEIASPAATFNGFRQADSDFIQEHIQRRWGRAFEKPERTEVLVKTPRSDITGNHFVDVLGRNPSITKVADLFLQKNGKKPRFEPFDSVEDLKEALEKQAGTQVKQAGTKKNAFRVLKSDDTGVWIETAGVGRAKVEGGVNMLMKVEPNGNLTGVMSDLHNFLEEARIKGVKVRNRPMEAILPNQVMAVSPPMQTNVVSVSQVDKFGPDAEMMREAQRETMPVPTRARTEAARERVEQPMGLTPSTGEVARQATQQAADYTMLGNMLSREEEPEQLSGMMVAP